MVIMNDGNATNSHNNTTNTNIDNKHNDRYYYHYL